MGVAFVRITYVTLVASLFLQVIFCSKPELAGGVETTNGVTIAIKQDQISGIAPAGSRIVLCDSSYAVYTSFEPFTPLFFDTTFADETGKFRFDSLPEGGYNLTARNFNADSGALITNISINRLNLKEKQKASEYAALGSIVGRVLIDSKNVGLALVYVMGTELRDTADGQGTYIIEKVPPGVYKITGSLERIFKPDSIGYYLSNLENITVPEHNQITGVDLDLERVH